METLLSLPEKWRDLPDFEATQHPSPPYRSREFVHPADEPELDNDLSEDELEEEDLFNELRALNSETPGVNHFIRFGEPEQEDIVHFTRYRLFEQQCDCGLPAGDPNCCLFATEEAQFVIQGGNDTQFARCSREAAFALECSLNLLNRLNLESVTDAILQQEINTLSYKVRRSAVYRHYMRAFLANDSRFFQNISEDRDERREYIDIMRYVHRWIGGQRSVYNYRAQGLTVSRSLHRMIVGDAPDVIIPGETVQDYVRKTCGRVWEKIRGLFAFLSKGVLDLIDTAYQKFLSYMCTAIFGKDITSILRLADPVTKKVIVAACVFSTWVIIKLMGIVTDQVANCLYSFAMSGLSSTASFVAQAEADPTALIASLCVGVIGLSIRDFGKIKTVINNVITAISGGTVAANTFKVLLLCLPPTLKMAFAYKFGTRAQKFEFEADRWCHMARSLAAISKIQTVLGSREYAKHVNDCVIEGSKIIRDCPMETKPLLKNALTSSYVRLLTIHANLTTKKYNSGDRQIPFAIHVSGPPGIGKTSMVRDTLDKAFDMHNDDIYHKDGADEFWSGYLDHPAIVMDEFLLGPPEDNYLKVQSYLTMVSSGEWRPNFASVDDPNVGIKGSCGRPKVVITMNNTIYDAIDNKIDEAHWRRRAFVVHCERSDRYLENEHNKNNVDLSRYTPEERNDRVWMKFQILPAIPVRNRGIIPIKKDLTYREMLGFVRVQYEHHCELFAGAMQDMNSAHIQERSADDILNEVIRDTFEIPSQPLSLVDALKATVMPFHAQGPAPEQAPEEYVAQVAAEVNETGTASTRILTEEPESGYWTRLIRSPFSTAVGLTAGLVVLLAAVGKLVKGETVQSETFYSQSAKTNKVTKGRGRTRNLQRASELKAQGPGSVIKLKLNGKSVNAVAVGGRGFVTYLHALDLRPVSDGAEWEAVVDGKTYKCLYNPSKVVKDLDHDLLYVDLECPQMPQFKDITKFFLFESELPTISNACVQVESPRGCFFSTAFHKSNICYVVNSQSENGETFTNREIVLDSCVEYRGVTEEGDCGSLVRVLSGNLMNRIAGIHVAGTGGTLVSNPCGVATFVTQEFINEARTLAREPLLVGQGPNERPNLISEEKLAWNEQVNVPTNSKLRPSLIQASVPWQHSKEPAVMSEADPRANGKNPIAISLEELYSADAPEIADEDLLKRIEDELVDKYNAGLTWPIGKRELSFEEACAGVPGWLNSINTSTSPGYPLTFIARKRGKTDFVWFEGQEMKYSPAFKELVMQKLDDMEEFDGTQENQHRFLGFLKDELRKISKIENCETRMTFANDMVHLVAFRMKFGALLVAFMNSFETTGFAIGLNQYSKDMSGIYMYLMRRGQRMGSGDYKSYDKNYVEKIQALAYRVITRVAIENLHISVNSCDYMIRHETKSPFQIGDKLVRVNCSNLSGCFWTTIVNCIVNNVYVMYCFYTKYPHLAFALYIALVVLGDDMIYSVGDGVDLTPLELGELMKKLGQVFTSAFKDRPLEDKYEPFENHSFLGAIPRRSQTGEWTGALRKETLYETPLWTRDNNASIDMVTQQMLDCASQWDRDFFDSYVRSLKVAYRENCREWNLHDNYSELHHSVLNRTAASGADFKTYFAQGPSGESPAIKPRMHHTECQCWRCKPYMGVIPAYKDRACKCAQCVEMEDVRARNPLKGQGPCSSSCETVSVEENRDSHRCSCSLCRVELYAQMDQIYEPGLTQIISVENGDVGQESGNLLAAVGSKAVSAEKATYDIAVHSFVKRFTYNWSSTQTAGTYLATFAVPFDILTANSTSNVQDVGFYQYLYSQPEVELKFLVNGTPVQQGALLAYFLPFNPYTAVSMPDMTMLDHVFITPNNNSASTLTIPFRYWKSWLDNKQGFTGSQFGLMGYVTLVVFSPLVTLTPPTTASVSVYSRIKSAFHVPRPRTLNGQGPRYFAQGLSFSTNNVNNDYHVGNVAGSMPSQTTLTSTAKQKSKLPAIKMDNPPVTGGSIPTHFTTPSMAKAIGAEPTTALQMHPDMMHRQPDSFRFTDETRIEDLMARRGFLPNGTFTISTGDIEGQEYLNIPINSVLGNTTPNGNNLVPANLAVLNQFQRWRADIEIELFCVKTVFHSARILVTTAYGYNGSLALLDFDAFPGRIVEFTGENQWASTSINFNAQTEFLRTYDGNNVNCRSDYSMGCFSFICLNPLKVASTVVSSSCQVLTFVKFHNVKVYEPRASNWVSLYNKFDLYQLVGQGPMDASSAIISPAGDGDIPRMPGDAPNAPTVGVTDSKSNTTISEEPCSIISGEKFEYCVRDLCEMGRRHTQMIPQDTQGYSSVIVNAPGNNTTDYSNAGNWTSAQLISFYVYPVHPICSLYAAWSGHLKFRIIITLKQQVANTYGCGTVKVGYVPSTNAQITQTVLPFVGTQPPAAGAANSTIFDGLVMMPTQTHVGKTGDGSTATWAANTYIVKGTFTTNMVPLEVAQQTTQNFTMIDVSVPFNTNMNMLPCSPQYFTSGHNIDPYNGRLVIEIPNFNSSNFAVELYQAFGDDFRLHAFAPSQPHYSDGYTIPAYGTGTITAPTGGIQIGQNVYY